MKFIKLTSQDGNYATHIRKDHISLVWPLLEYQNGRSVPRKGCGVTLVCGKFDEYGESPEAVLAMLEDEDVVVPK